MIKTELTLLVQVGTWASLLETKEGSLEDMMQNAIRSWEMEFLHKIRLQDFKTINHDKFKLFVNGNYLKHLINTILICIIAN